MAYSIAPVAHLAKLDDTLFLEFFSDTMYWMRGEKIPFLKKYSEHIDPEDIPLARAALKALMSKSLCQRVTSQGEFLGQIAELSGGEDALGGK